MRNRRWLTTPLVLVGILALVGCTSSRLEYANSHGYYPAGINGKKYYCTPKPWVSGKNSSNVVNCLTVADFENVRTGKQHPPSPLPATVLDLPHGFHRVVVNDQQMYCWRTFAAVRTWWSCDSSLTIAKGREQARNEKPHTWGIGPASSMWTPFQ
jgi:hypothetical protein